MRIAKEEISDPSVDTDMQDVKEAMRSVPPSHGDGDEEQEFGLIATYSAANRKGKTEWHGKKLAAAGFIDQT